MVWLVKVEDDDGVQSMRASSELQFGALREVVAREKQGTLSRKSW